MTNQLCDTHAHSLLQYNIPPLTQCPFLRLCNHHHLLPPTIHACTLLPQLKNTPPPTLTAMPPST